MLKRLFITSILTSGMCLATAPLEIDKSHLQLPSEVSTASIFLDTGTFKMLLENDAVYTFSVEDIDADLRQIDPLTLSYRLGMIWNIDCNGIKVVSDCITPEKLQALSPKYPLFIGNVQNIKSLLESKPAGAYLQIYRLDNCGYGIHLCPRISGGGLFDLIWRYLMGKSVRSENGDTLPTDADIIRAGSDNNSVWEGILAKEAAEDTYVWRTWQYMQLCEAEEHRVHDSSTDLG